MSIIISWSMLISNEVVMDMSITYECCYGDKNKSLQNLIYKMI